jgi:hypothetical protein
MFALDLILHEVHLQPRVFVVLFTLWKLSNVTYHTNIPQISQKADVAGISSLWISPCKYIYYSMTTRSLATLTLCGVRVALFMENMTENYLEHK